MMRSIAAVLAGCALQYGLGTATSLIILSVLHPAPPEGGGLYVPTPALTTFLNVLYGCAAGYFTAFIARRRPILHAAIVAAICVLPTALFAGRYLQHAYSRFGPSPWQASAIQLYLLILLQPLAVLFGGWISVRLSGHETARDAGRVESAAL